MSYSDIFKNQYPSLWFQSFYPTWICEFWSWPSFFNMIFLATLPFWHFMTFNLVFNLFIVICFIQQSVSVTANHEPLLGLPLTPTKRQAFQDCDDEAGTSQISHMSHHGGSFVRKPPLSTNSVKRKCNSTGFPDTKCGSSSAQCHCYKKRYHLIRRIFFFYNQLIKFLFRPFFRF